MIAAAHQLWLAAAAVMAGVDLFYRYLRFFGLYAVEALAGYAEAAP